MPAITVVSKNFIYPLNNLRKVYIQQEGDTVRDFFQNIAFPVSLAWNGDHFLERSESGTPGPTDHNKTDDHLYSWKLAGSMESERYAYLLIIRFRAGGRRGVKSNDCTIDVWCFPRSSAYANVCTARYGLYRLVWRGWMQLIVTKAGNPAASLGGFTRGFECWSGRPFWRDEADRHKVANHPGGYYRAFD
ncbi:hypothetical protein CJF30_00011051 [Rutstroemia sp. NJR-2017a BBW]|nr:hypothetical protein CJF30_00011051 [Rutstroemia sp. NJR-2017a BBW]